jgi:hypothetical protein
VAKKTGKRGGSAKEEAALEAVPHLSIAESQENPGPVEVAGDLFEYMQSVVLNPRMLGGDRKGGVQLRAVNGANMAGEPVGEWMLDSSMSSEDLQGLAMGIAQFAEAEARGIGPGAWSFALYAHVDGVQKPLARRRFIIHVEDEGQGDATIDPSQANGGTLMAMALQQLGQNQRHIEVMARQNAVSVQAAMGTMQALTGMIMQRAEVMERTFFDAINVIRKGADDDHKHKMESWDKEAKLTRNAALTAKLLEMAPTVVPMLIEKLEIGKGPPAPAPTEVQTPPTVEAVLEWLKASGVDARAVADAVTRQAQATPPPPVEVQP